MLRIAGILACVAIAVVALRGGEPAPPAAPEIPVALDDRKPAIEPPSGGSTPSNDRSPAIRVAEPARAPAAPRTAPAVVRLVAYGPDGTRWRWPLEARLGAGGPVLTFVDGVATIRDPVVGSRMSVVGDAYEAYYAMRDIVIDGPARHGASVERRVEVELHGPFVTGRVAPHAELRVQRVFAWRGGPVRGRTAEVVCDVDGRFLVPLRPGRVYRSMRIRRVEHGRVTGVAEVPLDGRPVWGIRDLGDVRLEPARLLAAGIVVNPDGAPWSTERSGGASVELHPLGVEGDYIELDRDEEDWPVIAVGISLHPGAPFYRCGLETVHVGSDGRFELWGVHDAPFSLCVRSPFAASADLAGVVPGTRGIRLVAAARGTLGGKLLVSDGVEAGDLTIAVYSAGRVVEGIGVQSSGRFRSPGLPAGSVDLVVRLRGDSAVLARVPGVEVIAKRVHAPPSLAAIDVRGRIAMRGVRIVGTEGAAIVGATLEPIGSGFTARKTDGHGSTTIPAAAGRFVVRAAGYRMQVVDGRAATIALDRGMPVRLQLDFGRTPPSDAVVVLYIDPVAAIGAEGPRPERIEATLAPGCSVFGWTAVAPGRYHVLVRFANGWGRCADAGMVTVVDAPPGVEQDLHVRVPIRD